MRGFFGQPRDLADLIPLVPQPEWELYHLFEARDEEPHALSDRELADRCGVDHDVPRLGDRFTREEMCEVQWACSATYYAWLDEEALRSAGPSVSLDGDALRSARSPVSLTGPRR